MGREVMMAPRCDARAWLLRAHSLGRGVCVIAMAMVMAACTAATSGATDVAHAVSGQPVLRVVFTWEQRLDGTNKERQNYRALLDACHAAGWPVHELSAQDEARLDTGRVEVTVGPAGRHVRQTAWSLARGDGNADGQSACQARLAEQVDQTDPGAGPGDGTQAIDTTESEQRRLAGLSGWSLGQEASVTRQTCKRWTSQAQEVCVWSGGRQWGFDDAPLDMAGCMSTPVDVYLTAIPLDAKPLGDNGCVVTLESFSLQKP